MATLTFGIPDEKLPRIVQAMKGLYPIPRDENNDPLFTDNQWAKESVRRLIIRDVARYEQKTAQQAIEFNQDDELLT